MWGCSDFLRWNSDRTRNFWVVSEVGGRVGVYTECVTSEGSSTVKVQETRNTDYVIISDIFLIFLLNTDTDHIRLHLLCTVSHKYKYGTKWTLKLQFNMRRCSVQMFTCLNMFFFVLVTAQTLLPTGRRNNQSAILMCVITQPHSVTHDSLFLSIDPQRHS